MRDVVFRLENPVQPYAWGSTTAIQELLGQPNDGRPVAELWLGAHPAAPSTVFQGGRALPLADLVHQAPEHFLGRRATETFGPRLPYLLKVLAAQRALSMQVHPPAHLARAGFNHENAAGIPLGSPDRTFADAEHKPEMIVALTPFEGLCGFRHPRRIAELLDGLDGQLVMRARAALDSAGADAGAEAAIRAAFTVLLEGRDADAGVDLARSARSLQERTGHSSSPRADALALRLLAEHPADPGAIASLLLHRFELAPGDAVFLTPGQVHAYVSGVGVEIMASSDNVLRAGLTPKRVDVDALLDCVSYAPRVPKQPRSAVSPDGSTRTWRPPVREFELADSHIAVGSPVELLAHGPRIVLCLDGAVELTIEHASTSVVLERGQSVLVADAGGALTAAGAGHLVVATVP